MNAGIRIDQGAVEVQQNGVSHDRKLAAEGKPVTSLCLTSFLFRVIRCKGQCSGKSSHVGGDAESGKTG